MGLWDDVKDLAGDAKDAVVDVFDGSDDSQDQPAVKPYRPEYAPQYQGNVFQLVNPAYRQAENEFEKPLWMQGADNQSPTSSWDNDFIQRAFKQQENLVEKGELGDQFDRKNATGVVTWDHVTKSGKELKFGDILDKGQLVGNLYEDKTGTPADADLMMGQFLLEPEELAQIGQDRNPQARLRTVLEEVRAKNNVDIPAALAVTAQQKEVDATQAGIQGAAGGQGDDIVAGALGAAGGAVIGGGLALSATGIGLVPGLGITAAGAGLSGLAAWLNRDDITEQVASAYEITEQAYNDDQGNVVGDTASTAKQWAGVLGRGLTPLSNLARGAADTDRGNGVGALQEADRPAWAKPVDIAATIGDMGLTFGSGLGVKAYTGQIGVSSAGAITELTLGGGERWDPQAGEFKNVYEDENGNPSISNGLGAWGSTGIDLAQLAMVRGVAARISGADQRAIGKTMNGGEVASVRSEAARTFYLDANEKVLASKVNLSQVFVPSEGVQFLAAGGLARGAASSARVAGRSTTAADDLYKASVAITRAEAPVKAALVNAVGEGTEEAVQEALDTWSFDHGVELQQLAEAYAYGAASGLGMGFAMNYRTRSEDGKELNLLARQGYELQHGPVTDEQWSKLYKSGLTSTEKQGYRASNFTPEQKTALKKALGTSVAEQGGSTPTNMVVSNAAAKVVELEQDRLTSRLGVNGRTIMRAAANTFQSLAARGPDGQVLVSNGAVADDSGSTGFTGLLTQYQEKLKRLPEVLQSIDRQVAEAEVEKARLAGAGADTGVIDGQIAQLQDTRALWAGSQPTLEEIIQRLGAVAPVMMQETQDPAELRVKRDNVDKINLWLDSLYRSQDDSQALAAAKFRLRSPFDNVGSFYVTGPALDWTMVRDNFDGAETMDWAALDTTTADFDGDRITGTTSLILGRKGFTDARTGRTWLNSAPDKDGNTVTSYKVASVGQDEAISTNLYLVHNGQRTPAAKGSPKRGLHKFVELVAARYNMPATEAAQMEAALEGLLLNVQNEKPIETLMTYFAQSQNPVSRRMVEYAETFRSNEASAITGIYRAAMDQAVAEVNAARWAALTPKQRKRTKPPRPNAYGVGQTKRSQQAVTLYSTFMQYYGTQDSLRIGQVLRQSGEDYTDTGVKGADTNALLVAAGAELRELAKGKIEAAYKGGLDAFDVTARVHEMALDITNGNHGEAYDLLTRKFGTATWDGKESVRAKYDVTVAQALTDSVVAQLRRQGATAIARDVDLQRKLSMLETASRDTQSPYEKTRADGETLILRDALGMFNVADVAGIGSTAGWETSGLLTTGSITQNVRILGKHDRANRARLRTSMLNAAENSANPETYRNMVALIHELANTEYSVDDTGKVYGRLADRNNSSSKAAIEIRQNVRQVTQELGLPLSHEGVLEALSTQNGQMIFDAFVKQTGIASFVKRADDTFAPRSWVLDYFTTERDGEAEVLLWRNRALTALHLASTRESLSANIKDEQVKDEYKKTDDSLAKLMIYLRDTNPVLLSELEIQLDTATSRESLEQWINANKLTFDMPVLMYENSAAQFDATLRSGGWGSATSNYGADLREVVETSRTFLSRTKELVQRRAVNVAAAANILTRMDDPNDGVVLAAREVLVEAADVSQVKTMDPNDTTEAAALIHQFGQEMYTKGADLEAIRAHSAQQVGSLMQSSHTDPFVDSVNIVLGVLDIKVLRARPELIFTALAFTDEYGRRVTVPPLLDGNGNPDLRLVMQAIVDDKQTGLADLLTEAILPRAYKYNRAADISTIVHRGPRNLRELFEQRFDQAFKTSASGAYTTEADLAFGAEVSAAAQTADQLQVAAFERATIAVATPRILSAKDAVEATDIARITGDASHALARVLRMAGQYINSTEGSPALYRQQVMEVAADLVANQVSSQQLRQDRMDRYRALSTNLRQEQRDAIMENVARSVEASQNRIDLDDLLARAAAGRFTDDQLNALFEQMMLGDQSAPMVRLFQSAANGDPYGDLEYLYGTLEVQSDDQRTNIAAYLNANPDLVGRLLHDPKATQAMAYFTDPTLPYASQRWDVLRNIVVSDIIQAEANPVTSQSDFLIVFDDPIRQDPTFSALFKELLLPENPLMAAAAGITADHAVPVDLTTLRSAMEDLFPVDGSIRWDQSVGAGTEMLDATYPSISAGQAATVHGNTGKTADAMAMAARTNSIDVPGPEYLQTVVVRRTPNGIQVDGPGAEFLDGAIGIVGGKTLEPMVVEGVGVPYQAMTFERLERALLMGEEVEVQFFHPMHRPTGARWHNSVFFDGVAAHNSPIVPDFPSLIAGMYMQANGITQRGTRFTLDAVKKKTPALYKTAVTSAGNLDLSKVSDPTEYLSTLATLLTGTELGYGTLGSVSFRPVLKYITMRHVVQYGDGGVSSVYEYMAQRAMDPDAMAAREPQLVALSERTANTLYGEVGTSGLQGYVPTGRLSYGQQAFNWDALTDTQLRVLASLDQQVDLGHTSAAARAALSAVTRGSQAEYRVALRDFGALYRLMGEAAHKQNERAERFTDLGGRVSQMQSNQKAVSNSLLANDTQAAGMQLQPDAMESLIAAMEQQDGDYSTSASYRLVLARTGDHMNGGITLANFNAFTSGLGDATFGDTITLALDDFTDGEIDQVVKIVSYMINHKVTITVRGGKSSELRNAVQRLLLETTDYTALEDQSGTYAPREAVAVYQLERAYISRAMEQRNTSAESRLLTFIPDEGQSGFGSIGESAAAIINTGKRQVVRNVLVKQFSSEFLTPIHRADTAAVRELIASSEFIDALRADVPEEEAVGMTHDQAVANLLERARDGELPLSTKNLQIRKGMFEVYVVNATRTGEPLKVYLHRHGSKFIDSKEIVKLRRAGTRSFVTGPTETEPQQTIVEGRVDDSRVRNDGLLLDVESDQFWRNNKLIPHLGGNKVMTQALPDDLSWLRDRIAAELSIDLVTNATDSMKKLSMMDSVRDFASAAELLGFDNMAVLYQGMYDGEVFNENDDESKGKMSALRSMLNTVARNNNGSYADVQNTIELIAKGATSDYRIVALTTLAESDPELTQQLGNGNLDTVPARVLLAAMAYLTLPGAQLSGIEKAGGFTELESRKTGLGSRRMPDMFTRIYDLADDTREFARNIFNTRLEPNVELLNDYSVRITHGQGFTDGRIAFSNYSVVGESQGDNYDPTVDQGVSSHDLRVLEQAAGAFFANNFDAGAFSQFVEDATTSDTVSPLRTAAPPGERQPWWNIGVAQQFYRAQAAKKLSYFFHEITLDNGTESEADVQQVRDLIRDLAKRLFRDSTGASDIHVHTMIRLLLGRPAASKVDEEEAAKIGLTKVRLALDAINGNISAGYSPLRRGAVSLVPIEIRNAYIAANVGKEGGIKFRVWTGKKLSQEFASTPDEITRAFFDHSLADPEANNIDAFNTVMDAVYHQYQQSSTDTMSLPVSLDLVKDLRLMSFDFQAEKALDQAIKDELTMAEFAKEMPAALATSLFRGTEIQLTPAVLHEMTNSATLAQRIGMNDKDKIDTTPPTIDVLNYVEKRLAAHDRSKDIPFPTKRSTQQVRDSGGAFTDNESNSNRIMRNLLALHAGKALLNPPLMLGALIDSRMRAVVADTRRMITGDSIGPIGRRVANVVESQGRVGALARGFGWRVMYTPKQVADVKRILNTTGLTGPMNEVIYKELSSYASSLNSQGVLTPIVKLNKIATAMQDIGHGTKGKTMRSAYLQTALADLVLRQGQDLDTALQGLSYDGAWLAKNAPVSHFAGVQAMNDLRGTQETVISSAISTAIRPLTHSGNAGVNAVAQMTLAMPLMFQRYAANLFLTLTGARAIDQLAAHALHGRQKPGFWNKVSASARSESTDLNPTIDMAEVIGGLDAMDAVINMGITHSLLFTGGLVAGGLGLGGEDDEEKRRRRAAAAQGAVWISDPRDIENDYRNAHALFLDEIPGLNVLFANDAGRAIASPHWIIKPLTSPLLGMERFFETGDIRQLKWGFEDAITSMPLLNMITFNKAVTMSEELSHAAQDAAAEGNLGASDSAGFLTYVTSYYESALFESSFINALYVGFDDYDRDPYVLPLRDSDGDLQRDAEGNVRANSDQHLRSDGLDGNGLALQPYVDAEGNVKQGYWTESDNTTKSRILAESRLSFALISSLVTGLAGEGLNTRYNMAVKTRTVDKPELGKNQEKAAVLKFYIDEANAALTSGGKPSAEEAVAMSFLDETGKEVLSHKGAKAIFNGLVAGSVTPSDASLQGVYIDYDTRINIQTEWLDELTIEGMRLGLSESSAKSRAYKVWNGTGDLPGIADILWSPDISYSPTQEFQQLNTTYIQGPDGNIWATGFERQRLLGAMGLAPLTGMHTSADTRTDMDGRMNVSGFGINNTGMRSLRPVNDSLDTPTDAEIGDAITKAIEKLDDTPYSQGYGGYGGYGGGGGGGGGYPQRPVFNSFYPPRWTNQNFNPITLRVPYANDVYSIRTDDVRTDTSTIRRERISSDRGRLTQWQ